MLVCSVLKCGLFMFFFFKQKTAYEMRISDWSSDVCSSDLIGGLVAGASKGEGLGNKFLSHIREVDAIVFVLRAFEDDDVPGPSDPLEHLGIVELALTYADLETVENQIEQRRKAAKDDRSLGDEVAAPHQAQSGKAPCRERGGQYM